ncbi:hypothetical protein BJ170DRAFT_681377 [Xylariales sp. AK1849]|nr:hypothetical protein BJ170DRAFT_681377 [Xylariales sp. AK1849]
MSQLNTSSNGGAEDMHYGNHPVYVEQRLKLEDTFKGKADQIAHQFHQFRQEVKEGLVETDQKTWEKSILNEDDDVELISNYASFDVLQYQDKPARAGMSMVHLLAIPRKNIYNGVYLNGETVGIIDDMIRLFSTTWADPEKREEILEHQRQAIEQRASATKGEAFSEQAHDAAIAHYEELKSKIHHIDIQDFEYGLHLRPDSSANHLHLHIIAAPYEFRKYSTSEHDKKTKDALEVRDFIVRDAKADEAADGHSSILEQEGSPQSQG